MSLKNVIILASSMLIATTGFAADYQLSTHILDINKGRPASNVDIELYKMNSTTKDWVQIAKSVTDENGRVKDFLPIKAASANKGLYKLKFHVRPYFDRINTQSFYPFIEVSFELNDDEHYHVPITLSPYGYSTYRGS